MTCVVGLVDRGKVYIGADSAAIGGNYALYVRADRKVYRNGEFVMGFTSSFRMGQLLAFNLMKLPKPPEGMDLFKYMIVKFIPVVRKVLKEGGYSKLSDGRESCGTFLVGFRGRLFRVEEDFQVAESTASYDACGCAEAVAFGSLFSTSHIADPIARVLEALQAAQSFSAGVREPFHVESV